MFNLFKNQNSGEAMVKALKNLNLAALSTLEIEPLTQAIVDQISVQMGFLFGVIALIDPSNQTLKRVAISKNETIKLEEILKSTPIPFKNQVLSLNQTDNLMVKAVVEKKAQFSDTLEDVQRGLLSSDFSKKIQQTLGTRSLFIYPLITKNRVLGAMYYSSTKDKSEVEELEIMVMEEFANEVARALDNAVLYQDLMKEREKILSDKNKLSILLSGITDAIIAVDLTKNIVLFNTTAEKLTGYKTTEVLGKKIDQIIKFYENSTEITLLTYSPEPKEGVFGEVYTKESLKMVGFNDKESFINLKTVQHPEMIAANLGSIFTITDITSSKQFENMKMDFVSMAAHELRTPLTSIKGYLNVFMGENKPKFNPDQNMFLDKIYGSTTQLVNLVENLLNVSRIERGVISLGRENLDWPEYLSSIIKDFTSKANEKTQTLEFVKPATPISKVSVDKMRLYEVVSNLIINAINYTPNNGHIKIWITEENNEVITHISDTGIGIAPENIPHLFQKFYRVAGKFGQGSKGTGLGLYITKGLVEMHQGRIWVESELGKGSTFSFSLPAFK